MKAKLPGAICGKAPGAGACLKPIESCFDLRPPISGAKQRKAIAGLLSEAALTWKSKREPSASDADNLLALLRSSRKASDSTRLSRLEMQKLRQAGGVKAHSEALSKIALRVEGLTLGDQLSARLITHEWA